MTEKTKQKAVIYLRLASVPANARDTIFEQQEAVCHRCAEANDLEIIAIYRDYAMSGNTLDRASFQKMLAFLKDNPDHCLIVADPARLSRNVIQLRDLLMDLSIHSRVKVISADTNRVLHPRLAA